jgi:WD40 repeat protein
MYKIGIGDDLGTGIALSENGQFLAASDYQYLLIADTKTGEVVASHYLGTSLNSRQYPVRVDISPDGHYAAAIFNNGTVHIMEAGTKEVTITGYGSDVAGSQVQYILFTPDSQHILFSNFYGDDPGIASYEIAEKDWNSHLATTGPLFLTSDGNVLATVGDHGIQLWDFNIHSPTLIGEIPVEDVTDIANAAISPDGTKMAISSHHDTVILWNMESNSLFDTIDLPSSRGSIRLAFSSDGEMLAISYCQGYLYRVIDGELLETLEPIRGGFLKNLSGYPPCISEVVFSPDGTSLYYGSNSEIAKWRVP